MSLGTTPSGAYSKTLYKSSLLILNNLLYITDVCPKAPAFKEKFEALTARSKIMDSDKYRFKEKRE